MLSEIIQTMSLLVELDWTLEDELLSLLFQQLEEQLCAFDGALNSIPHSAVDVAVGQALEYSQIKVKLQQKMLSFECGFFDNSTSFV